MCHKFCNVLWVLFKMQHLSWPKQNTDFFKKYKCIDKKSKSCKQTPNHRFIQQLTVYDCVNNFDFDLMKLWLKTPIQKILWFGVSVQVLVLPLMLFSSSLAPACGVHIIMLPLHKQMQQTEFS